MVMVMMNQYNMVGIFKEVMVMMNQYNMVGILQIDLLNKSDPY